MVVHIKIVNVTQSQEIKLQVIFDYVKQSLSKLAIRDAIRSDQGYKDYLENIKKKELWIFDLGYFAPFSFKKINDDDGYFISRYKTDTNLYDKDNELKINLVSLLESSSKELIEKDFLLGKEAKLKVKMVAYRLTKEQSVGRKMKATKLAKSCGYKLSRKNQALLNWSIFITNIPEGNLHKTDLIKLNKLRWQIELLFKLYKSNIKINNLRAKKNSSRVLCELYAKLTIAVLFHGIFSLNEIWKTNSEFSNTKAFLELKRRARELYLSLNKKIHFIKLFLENIIISWKKLALKDKYRKNTYSTFGLINSINPPLT
jgi:hypothetical protein